MQTIEVSVAREFVNVQTLATENKSGKVSVQVAESVEEALSLVGNDAAKLVALFNDSYKSQAAKAVKDQIEAPEGFVEKEILNTAVKSFFAYPKFAAIENVADRRKAVREFLAANPAKLAMAVEMAQMGE